MSLDDVEFTSDTLPRKSRVYKENGQWVAERRVPHCTSKIRFVAWEDARDTANRPLKWS